MLCKLLFPTNLLIIFIKKRFLIIYFQNIEKSLYKNFYPNPLAKTNLSLLCKSWIIFTCVKPELWQI